MNKLQVPEFATYEEEAAFRDNIDTTDFMPEDEEWFHFETPNKRAVQIPVLPEIALELIKRARVQGVSIETLVNVFLMERIQKAV
uniref:CopG antitoxin of type II toxin-antitoxin system n=1 Tax=Candidatus Kentrum eta TaxID=2126337 RepID=A0A450UQR5_9GAMM|nr:MAG: CopG antitoxin of type II toxin-antitoxin system [Candidatus Kentron sp. H]VFJ94815.1 MAG: CopG antitoxin of type II toxin-antitoxin system [Candidatus Kentron sp. H]VFK01921.1 MAG: CopG antitoxin of type II toxin-antitoxin system [Candidatus Kentron sp. H]